MAETGRREQWIRLLPAHLTGYYLRAMTLFSSSGYEEVMRSLTEGLTWTSDGAQEYVLPSQVAITKARTRLGPKPLALLSPSTWLASLSKRGRSASKASVASTV